MPKMLSEKDIIDFREKLCRVATKQFTEKGYEKVSMRSLADELEVSRMTPYNYFKDKAEILAFVRARGFKQLIDTTEKTLALSDDTIKLLELLAPVYLQFAVENEDLYRLMFDISQEGETDYPELAEQLERLNQLLIKASTIAIDAGLIQQDATLASQLFWAGMHGVVTLHLSNKLQLGWSSEDLTKQMLYTLFRGMIRSDK